MKIQEAIEKFLEAEQRGSDFPTYEAEPGDVPKLLSQPPSLERAIQLAAYFERVRARVAEASLIERLSKK